MRARYYFYLDNGTESTRVLPVWKDDLALEYAFENNQMFRRSSLSGSLVFVGADYDWIMATPFESKITLTIRVRWHDTDTEHDYWQGSFHLTDCTVNMDDRRITVKPQVDDRYNAILAGLEKEYDLIKLTPAVQPVNMVRRPMLQIYAEGDSVVSCFLSGMAWEQEASDSATEGELINDFHFAKIGESDFVEINISSETAGLTEPFIGKWGQHGNAQGEWADFTNSEGVYYIAYFQQIIAGDTNQFINGLRIYSLGTTSPVLWEYKQTAYGNEFDDIPTEFVFTHKQEGWSDLNTSWKPTPIYGRWCVAEKLAGAYNIPSNDIVPYNRNYQYCTPFDYQGTIRMSYNYSATPTQWGLRPDGNYYDQPNLDPAIIEYFPVARSTWGMASIWFCQSAATEAIEEDWRVPTLLRDAYTLEAVIGVLLGQVAPGVTFEGTSAYSEILYGTNPFTPFWGRLVMSPKSNVLVAEYTQPARKAPITLGEVLDMLRDALGLYWFIDDSSRLRIEHISWFKAGGSYSGTPTVGIDLTEMGNSRNGKKWSFGTGEYTYEKVQMPERYQYEWMDDTTDVFKGEAIEVLSTYVQEGNIEEVSISKFNPDVDYMMLNPSNVSEDGFALLCAQVSGGEYTLPIVDNLTSEIQNGLLAMTALQPVYLISDMPSWNIRVNGGVRTANGIQRKKEQKVSIPVGEGDPDMSELVHTTVGDGEIKDMSINLSSRMATTTLRYDTTQQ